MRGRNLASQIRVLQKKARLYEGCIKWEDDELDLLVRLVVGIREDNKVVERTLEKLRTLKNQE